MVYESVCKRRYLFMNPKKCFYSFQTMLCWWSLRITQSLTALFTCYQMFVHSEIYFRAQFDAIKRKSQTGFTDSLGFLLFYYLLEVIFWHEIFSSTGKRGAEGVVIPMRKRSFQLFMCAHHLMKGSCPYEIFYCISIAVLSSCSLKI